MSQQEPPAIVAYFNHEETVKRLHAAEEDADEVGALLGVMHAVMYLAGRVDALIMVLETRLPAQQVAPSEPPAP